MTEADSELQPTEPPAQPIERLLRAFGGVQALARRLDVPAATVREWRAKGTAPRERLPAIVAAAEREGIALDADLLAGSVAAAPTIDAEPAAAMPVESDAAVADPPAADPPVAGSPAPDGPAASREKPGRSGRLRAQLPALILGGLLVVAGFALAMATSDLWLDASPDLAERVEELEARAPQADALNSGIAALEQQVAELKQQIAQQPAETDAAALDAAALDAVAKDLLAELDRRLAALPATDPARLDSIEGTLADIDRRIAALADGQGALEQAVAKIEATPPAPPAPTVDLVALAAATAALAAQVQSGVPFAAELAIVGELGASKPELAAPLAILGAHAVTGIATVEALRRELSERIPAILLAATDATGEAADGDAVDRLVADLSLLLGGRPVGEVEGDGADARLARAELRLEQGDLAAALAEVKALEGAAAAAPWIERAEARIAALDAAEQVQQLASSWLAGK